MRHRQLAKFIQSTNAAQGTTWGGWGWGGGNFSPVPGGQEGELVPLGPLRHGGCGRVLEQPGGGMVSREQEWL